MDFYVGMPLQVYSFTHLFICSHGFPAVSGLYVEKIILFHWFACIFVESQLITYVKTISQYSTLSY